MDKSYKDFADEIRRIGEHFLTHKKDVETEQHTKTAFIQPLIVALGYQLDNPQEVVPEPVADLKAKKGEKVDYVIKLGGNPILTIECKHWEYALDRHKAQLYRYYHNISAKFGVLTNGKDYEFFADLDKPNVMDNGPFFKFDITSIKEFQIEFLWKFSK
jgi:predicted type IV restriction endonuclease